MSNTNKLIVGLLVAVAIIGSYFYPQVESAQLLGSTAGTTFSTSKIASQQVTLGTTTAFAIQNTDASDRIIQGVDIVLRAATATSTTYGIVCATSTTASSLQSNPNYVVNTSLATSTFGSIIGAGTFVASSSPGIMGTSTASVLASLANPFGRVWATNTYLVCQVTTADGYNAFNSTTNGTITFPYRAQ